jgi:L-threonylcarbamoyladenylate synthase
MITEILSAKELKRAAELVLRGELVAFPTETVYGLGASIARPEAIEKIYAVKGRPADNPLIVHLASVDQVKDVAVDVPELFYALAKVFVPGPLTFILKRHPSVPFTLPTIAVRIPSHPVAHAFLKEVGVPVAAPSANLSGKPSSTTAAHVLADFDGQIGAVIDGGATPLGLESTVMSLLDPERPQLLRKGTIRAEEIERVMGRQFEAPNEKDKAASPGTRYRHYAPKARLTIQLLDPGRCEAPHSRAASQQGKLVLTSEVLNGATLYALLRQADLDGVEEIIVLCDEKIVGDEALMDRLTRAADSTAR